LAVFLLIIIPFAFYLWAVGRAGFMGYFLEFFQLFLRHPFLSLSEVG
jgi:hypothetical protein